MIAVAGIIACQPKEEVDFTLDGDTFEVGSEGGVAHVGISAPGSWIATSNVPWVTVSPANGRGAQDCQIIVDSALAYKSADDLQRRGVVTIEGENWETRDISIVQNNYDYTVSVEDADVRIPDYIDLSDRHFDVKVKSNVKFKLRFEDENGSEIDWIEAYEENPELILSKGARPRNVTLRFDWKINQNPANRAAKVVFIPVDDKGQEIQLTQEQKALIAEVDVTQTSAAPKPKSPRAADSTALLAIARALNVWSDPGDPSQRMDLWDDVILWEEGDDTDPANYGRVKYVRFFMFNTDDGLPYQVEWLDAAEEIVFYSNENSNFRKDIKLGEEITKLPNLKRLTIAAYGLDDGSFPDNFFSPETFPNLEYLNLSSNNFTYINKGFNKTNFPKLRVFMMNSNQKQVLYDISNSTVDTEENFAKKYGGLYLENLEADNMRYGGGFPARFLDWEELDTLQLTLNYLQGLLPTDEDLRNAGFATWKDDDPALADSVAVGSTFFANNAVPRVFPNIRSLTINLNRFHGPLSLDTHKWILYHPNLDWMDPYTFIFTQEGTDWNGNPARFENLPINMDYYYRVYPNKVLSPTYVPPADEE